MCSAPLFSVDDFVEEEKQGDATDPGADAEEDDDESRGNYEAGGAC